MVGLKESPHIIFPWLGDKKVYLNKLYKITVSNKTEIIYDKGARSYIADLAIADLKLNGDSNLFVKMSDYLVDKMDWDLENNKGKFITRLSSFFHKVHKKEISQLAKTKIVEYINTLYPPEKEYYFDIDVSLHWLKGEFGDYNSCFFDGQGNGNSSFSKLRETDGYYSIRFFKPFPITSFPENSLKYLKTNFPFSYYIEDKTIYRGYARNWLRYGVGVDYPVIFNSYGHTSRMSSLIFKEFLSPEGLTLRNINATNTNLYNNGDGVVILPVEKASDKIDTVNCNSNKTRKPFLFTEEKDGLLEGRLLEYIPSSSQVCSTVPLFRATASSKVSIAGSSMFKAFAELNNVGFSTGLNLAKEEPCYKDIEVEETLREPARNIHDDDYLDDDDDDWW